MRGAVFGALAKKSWILQKIFRRSFYDDFVKCSPGTLYEDLGQDLGCNLRRFLFRGLAHAHDDLARYFQRPCATILSRFLSFFPNA